MFLRILALQKQKIPKYLMKPKNTESFLPKSDTIHIPRNKNSKGLNLFYQNQIQFIYHVITQNYIHIKNK